MSDKKGWGRPRGSRMSEEAKKKISASVRKRYQEWKALQVKEDSL